MEGDPSQTHLFYVLIPALSYTWLTEKKRKKNEGKKKPRQSVRQEFELAATKTQHYHVLNIFCQNLSERVISNTLSRQITST